MPLDAGSPRFEAPALAATDIVDCASRRQVAIINCTSYDDNDDALGCESCGNNETPMRHVAPFQVYMTNPVEPAKNPTRNGKNVEPNKLGDPVKASN